MTMLPKNRCRQRGMALSSYAEATEDRAVPLRGSRWLVPACLSWSLDHTNMNTPSETKAFAHQAAKLSWVCPIIIFLLLVAGKTGQFASDTGFDSTFAYRRRFAFLVSSLCLVFPSTARRQSSRQLLSASSSMVCCFSFCHELMTARARAIQQHSQH